MTFDWPNWECKCPGGDSWVYREPPATTEGEAEVAGWCEESK